MHLRVDFACCPSPQVRGLNDVSRGKKFPYLAVVLVFSVLFVYSLATKDNRLSLTQNCYYQEADVLLPTISFPRPFPFFQARERVLGTRMPREGALGLSCHKLPDRDNVNSKPNLSQNPKISFISRLE